MNSSSTCVTQFITAVTILPVDSLCPFLSHSQPKFTYMKDTLTREYPTAESIFLKCVTHKATFFSFLDTLHVRHVISMNTFYFFIDSQHLHMWKDTFARKYPTLGSICLKSNQWRCNVFPFWRVYMQEHIWIHICSRGKSFYSSIAKDVCSPGPLQFIQTLQCNNCSLLVLILILFNNFILIPLCLIVIFLSFSYFSYTNTFLMTSF